jgi:hypothetical protein
MFTNNYTTSKINSECEYLCQNNDFGYESAYQIQNNNDIQFLGENQQAQNIDNDCIFN